MQAIEAALSQDLDHVVGWLNQNHLMLNHSKTKVMLMGTHQKLSSVQSFTVSVNDKDLERVYKFKYLGVILDPCLTWNDHIEHIGNKISSRLGMLRRAPKVIPKEACITLFNAMVLPLFDYCCVVWDGTLLAEAFSLCFSALYCHSLRGFGCSRFVLVVSVPRKRPLQTADWDSF